MGGVAARWLAVVVLALGVGPLATLQVDGDVLVVSAIDVAAACLAAHALWDVRRRGWHADHALAAVVALLAVLAAQLATTGAPVAVVGGMSRFVTAGACLFGLSQLAGRASPHGDQLTWQRVLVVGGALLGAWVLVDWFVALRDPSLTTFYRVKNAVVLPLGASNYLAGFLVVALLVAVWSVRRDAFLRAPALLVAGGLLATMSRGALLAVLVVLLGQVIGRRVGARAGLVAGAGLALVTVALLVAVNLDGVVVDSAPDALQTPTDERMHLLHDAGEAFLANPLLGVGINRFATVATTSVVHDHAHNMVMHALATTGLLGTTAYLALWITLFVRLVRAAPSPGRSALRAAAAGLFVHAQFEALAFTRGIEVVLAVLLVLAATLRRHGDDAAGRDDEAEPVPAPALPAYGTAGVRA